MEYGRDNKMNIDYPTLVVLLLLFVVPYFAWTADIIGKLKERNEHLEGIVRKMSVKDYKKYTDG